MQKYDFIKSTFNFSNAPIKRFVKIEKKEDLLKKLKDEISNIENCTLKNNSNNLVFADGELSRGGSKSNVKKRQDQALDAFSILGIKKSHFLNYEDQKLDTISTVQLAQDIEKIISQWNPDTVYTHYYGDLNQDHRKVFEATTIATRPTPNSNIKDLICFETPSSTEWNVSKNKFNPNLFTDIESVIDKKLKAISCYKKEINPSPHPRSLDAIKNRSKHWGSTVGLKYAEAFHVIRQIK